MARYPALIDGEGGAYGVTFPDLPGIVAMGDTVEDALVNAEEALRDYMIEAERDGAAIESPSAIEPVTAPTGSALVSRTLDPPPGRRVRTNQTLDEGVAEFIDDESKRRHMTRTAFVEWMARRIAQKGG